MDFSFKFLNLLTVLLTVCYSSSSAFGLSRHKRQSDATTEVVGLSIDQAATEGDYQTLKAGARSVARREKRAAQGFSPFGSVRNSPASRSSSVSFSDPAEKELTLSLQKGTESLGTDSALNETQSQVTNVKTLAEEGLNATKSLVLTLQQQLFNAVNYDFKLATAFQELINKEKSPVLSRMVIVKEGGVTCTDVCRPEGKGYSTLGICTAKYCKCDFEGGKFEMKDCEIEGNNVFDPLSLSCKKATETVLCSSEEDDESSSKSKEV